MAKPELVSSSSSNKQMTEKLNQKTLSYVDLSKFKLDQIPNVQKNRLAYKSSYSLSRVMKSPNEIRYNALSAKRVLLPVGDRLPLQKGTHAECVFPALGVTVPENKGLFTLAGLSNVPEQLDLPTDLKELRTLVDDSDYVVPAKHSDSVKVLSPDSIRKALSNTTVPRPRSPDSEADRLRIWLDKMLNSALAGRDVFENSQRVYAYMFQLLTTRLDFYQSGLGSLLQRTFKAYFGLLVKAIHTVKLRNTQQKAQFHEELAKADVRAAEGLVDLQQKLQELKLSRDALVKQLKSQEELLEMKRQHEASFKSTIDMLQEAYQKTKVRLARAEDVNRTMSQELKRYIHDLDTDSARLSSQQEFRFRSLATLLLEDPLLRRLDEIEGKSRREYEAELEQLEVDSRVFLSKLDEVVEATETKPATADVGTAVDLRVADAASQASFGVIYMNLLTG